MRRQTMARPSAEAQTETMPARAGSLLIGNSSGTFGVQASMTRPDRLLVFSATATLAIAIAANTTLFSIAGSILIRPLPYPDPARLDWIAERSGPGDEDVGAAPDYYRIRAGSRVFAEVAAFNSMTVNST